MNRYRIEKLGLKMFEIKFSQKIILYILFIYQMYDIFNDYFQYNYSIELDFDVNSRTLPSITICIDEKYDSTQHWKILNEIYEAQTFVCMFSTNMNKVSQECNEKKVYLRYRHQEICLTFFNNKTENYYKIQNGAIVTLFSNMYFMLQKVIVHPPDTPSHFEINNVFVSKPYINTKFYIKKVTKVTLPKPYSTDCHDYSQHQISSLSPRSQTYCIFEYMRKEELNKCGKNIYWNQYVIDYNPYKQILKFQNQSSNKCIVKYDYKLLSRLCKIDCISEKYTVRVSYLYSSFPHPISEIPIPNQYNIYFSYNPELNMEQFCSNFGGLISMYFGLSIIDIAIIILNKIFYIRWIKLIKMIISIIFKYLIKYLCYILMLYQLTMVFKLYIEENRKITIAFTNEMKFNKIILAIEPIIDFYRNHEYYRNFVEEINNFENNYERYQYTRDHIYNVFLHNITTFVYITRLLEIKIECTLIFENNIQLDCGEIILSKITVADNINFIYNIPADNSINSSIFSNLKQISIKFIQMNDYKYTDFETSFYIHFYNSIFLSYLPNEINPITIIRDCMNTIIVEPIYYRRLTYFGRQCDPRDKSLFDDSLTDDCIMDCFQKRSIIAFNCIPFKKSFGFIRWKRDLMENNYNLCNQSYNKVIEIDTFIRQCIKECQFDCELGLYKITQFYDFNPLSGDNNNQIKIIPRSNIIVQYEEQYVMDGWELIYQLGGVVGMWVGWSALSITSILNHAFAITLTIKHNFHENINKFFISFKIHFRKLIRKLKTFWFTLLIYISECFIDFIEKYSQY